MRHWIAVGLALAALPIVPAKAQDALSLPTVTANYTLKAPKLDGKLQDPAWLEASPFTLAKTYDGQDVERGAIIRAAWDTNNLYFAFEVPDPIIVADRLGRDGLIFEHDDVMELFFWPDERLPYYYEVVVNPRGTIYDAFLVARPSLDGPELTLLDWSPDIRSSGTLKPILYRPGRIGSADPEGYWIIEMSIPLRAFSSRGVNPPASGETWRFQINRFNRPDPTPGALDATVLSPYDRLGWPHLLNRFGQLRFVGSAPEPPPVIPPVIPESGTATAVPTVSDPTPTLTLPPVTVRPPADPKPADPVTPPADPKPADPVTPPSGTTPSTPINPTTTTVSINFQETPMRDALATLFKGTGLNYLVTPGALENAPVVTIKVDDVAFETALRIVVRTGGLDVRRVDGVYNIVPVDAPVSP